MTPTHARPMRLNSDSTHTETPRDDSALTQLKFQAHATQFRLNTPPKLHEMTKLRHNSSTNLSSRLHSDSIHSGHNESDLSQTRPTTHHTSPNSPKVVDRGPRSHTAGFPCAQLKLAGYLPPPTGHHNRPDVKYLSILCPPEASGDFVRICCCCCCCC